MKNIIIFLFLIFTLSAFGQGDAPPFIQGQSQATKSVATVIKTPHSQATKLTSSQALIETGNKNRLVNPGFEHQTIGTGWSTSFTGDAGIPGGVVAAATPFEGTKSAEITCVGGAVGGTCTFYQDVSTGFETQALASIFIKPSVASSAIKVYARKNGANTAFLKDTFSFPITDYSLVSIPIVGGTTSTGIAIEITVGAFGSVAVVLDEAHVGYQSVTASVNVVGPWTDYTPATNLTNVTAVGKWRQVGQNIETTYRLTFTGTPSAVGSISVNLPTGSTVDTAKMSAPNVLTPIGKAHLLDVSAGINYTIQSLYSGNGDFLTYQNAVTGQVVAVTHASPVTLTTGDIIDGGFSLPVTQFAASTNTLSSTNGNTSWASCGHTFTDFNGFGTVTNIETQCKRDGDDLLMRGKFTPGTGTGVEARLNLKLNGVTLTSAGAGKIPSIQSAGFGAFTGTGATSSYNLIEPSVGYITFSQQNASTGSLTKLLGSSYGTGSPITINARVPISNWENSNVIVASLKDTPTTIGSTGSDFQSVYFGASADCSTACTTGTCTLCNQVGNKITSVTWNATGEYNVNGIDGKKYNCNGSGFGSTYGMFVHNRPNSTTSYARVGFTNNTGTNANTGFASLTCTGIP